MRDRTNAARAALKSEIYRSTRRASGAPLGGHAVPPARAAEGSGDSRRRKSSAARPQFTALALLGLLDLIKGG